MSLHQVGNRTTVRIEGIPNIAEEIIDEKAFQVPLNLWRKRGLQFEKSIMDYEKKTMGLDRNGPKLFRFQDLSTPLPVGLVSDYGVQTDTQEPVIDGYIKWPDGHRSFVEIKKGFHNRLNHGTDRYCAVSIEQLSALVNGRRGGNHFFQGGEIWVYNVAKTEDIPLDENGRRVRLRRNWIWLKKTVIKTGACAALLADYENRRWVHIQYQRR